MPALPVGRAPVSFGLRRLVGGGGGSLVLVSESFEGYISTWRRDSDGRVISLLIELYNVKINLVAIYASLIDRKTFFESLHEFFLPGDGVIVAGDFIFLIVMIAILINLVGFSLLLNIFLIFVPRLILLILFENFIRSRERSLGLTLISLLVRSRLDKVLWCPVVLLLVLRCFSLRHQLLLMCQPEVYWLLKQCMLLFSGWRI